MARNGHITLVSNKGKGSSKRVQIPIGMTAKELFHSEISETGKPADPDDYTVMVDGVVVADAAKCKLADGQVVVIVPQSVKGN